MKRVLSHWQFAGFVFTGIAGVILHFLYDWTGGSAFVAPFSAVNESIWEHMKILFFPLFIFAFIENYCIGKDYNNFWCVKLLGTCVAIAAVPILYYTLNGAFGPMPDWVNVAIYYISAALCYILEVWLFNKNKMPCNAPKARVLLWVIAFVFVFFTFFPPIFPLFKDPVSGMYGIAR